MHDSLSGTLEGKDGRDPRGLISVISKKLTPRRGNFVSEQRVIKIPRKKVGPFVLFAIQASDFLSFPRGTCLPG